MSALRVLVGALVFLALLLLALSNAEPVTLRLFNFASTDSPLASCSWRSPAASASGFWQARRARRGSSASSIDCGARRESPRAPPTDMALHGIARRRRIRAGRPDSA
jgi:hypothetical protein